MYLSSIFEAQQTSKQRMNGAWREAERCRLVQAAKGSREIMGRRRLATLIAKVCLLLGIGLQNVA